MLLPLPSIKKYSSARKYLADIYKYRKHQNPSFTFESWSYELGYRSPAFMHLVYIGKRQLTINVISQLSDQLKLDDSEKNYFVYLAEHEKTQSDSLKKVFKDKILENLKFDESALDSHDYMDFILSPTMPLIKILLSYDEFNGTLKNISQALNIDKKQVQNDLQSLEKLGLIKKTSKSSSTEARWEAVAKAYSISDKDSKCIMPLFHHESLKESASVNTQNDIFKKFRTILFAINPNEQEHLLTEIELFLTKIKNLFGQNSLDGKQIIKLNLQAYEKSPIIKTL